MRDVAAEVGINIGTLHYYFPSKEALIRGVVEHATDRFRTTLEPHASSSDQLRDHLRAVRRLMTAEPELGIVMGELGMRANRDPTVRKIVEEMYSTWQASVRGLLRRAARDGKLAPEMDSDATASLIMGTLMSANLAPMSASGRGDQAVDQLERLLGISGSIN